MENINHLVNKVKSLTMMCNCVLDGKGSRSQTTSSYGADRTDDMSSRNCHYHEQPLKPSHSPPPSIPDVRSLYFFRISSTF